MRHRPLVLLTALVFAMVACGGSDDAATTAIDTQTTDTTEAPTPATTATTTMAPDTTVPATSDTRETPVDVFSFADDNLCEWVTQEQVAGFIAEAFDWNGTVNQTPPDAPANCEWTLASDEGQTVTWAYDAQQWERMDGTPIDLAALDAVDFSDIDPTDFNFEWMAVSGHPALSEGVVVTVDVWGEWAFWVPPREEYLALRVSVPGEELSYPADDRVFMVADQFLHELGWVG